MMIYPLPLLLRVRIFISESIGESRDLLIHPIREPLINDRLGMSFRQERLSVLPDSSPENNAI